MSHPFSYAGKHALVTGGASGVGAALLEVLAELDVAHVTVVDVRVPDGPHDDFRSVDLADETAVDALAAGIEGPIHALFNNAGVADTSPPHTVIGVNYLALRRLSESLIDRIPEGGAIVNTASTAGGQWATHLAELTDVLSLDGWDETLAWVDANLAGLGVQPYFLSKELVQLYTLRSSRPT